jgi:2-iminobutanoate/2-iminopropanoate deaminase
MIGVVRTGALVMLAASLITRGAMTQEAKGGERPEIEFLTPYGPPTRPFSPAVRVGNLIFLSGQIGVRADAGGTLVPGGIQPETRQTLENIRDVLQRVGSSMDRVVKCTVMLADMAEWGAMNEAYTTFFPTNKPARSALGASGLALNARVEIECIAVAGE